MPPLVKRQDTTLTTRVNDAPERLKPYIQHGVQLRINNDEEARGNCPFCGREEKFSINKETGQWRCFVCGGGKDKGGGGVFDFLERIWDVSEKSTRPEDYKLLAAERGLQFFDSLIHWGVVKSVITGKWLIPAWGLDIHGKLRIQQLYIYTKLKDRMVLLATSGLKHALFGLTHYDESKPDIHTCEGPWDGIRYWELLRTTKVGPEGTYIQTSNIDNSLLNTVNVLAVPGCGNFGDSWSRWYKGKAATFLYDNDHPKKAPDGSELLPAGWAGMKRAAIRVSNAADVIYYLAWGADGYDPELPDGYDLRDHINQHNRAGLLTLTSRIQPVPEEWLAADSVSYESGKLSCKTCTNYNTLTQAWRKAMKWTEGLDHALATMLASVVSTNTVGDQLWFKVIGPASCGKSTLCEAFNVNTRYVISKSTIRGFHSGYRESSDESEDNSLINQLRGKTLVTKDGDTLLQSPNLGQILAEARDLYDSTSRTHYRNKASKDYEGIRWTWLLCGTSSLRSIDNSELGERFLDCVIMDNIDEDLEDAILLRVANKAANSVDIEVGDDLRSQHAPELAEAMELTGGYIDWLRTNASKELPNIAFSDHAKSQCIQIGKLVAYMRARPSNKQKEKAERELAARLVSQHTRFAKCLALVLNRKEVDATVMARVRRIGLDTSRGVVFDITKSLYETGLKGREFNGLLLYVNCGDTELRNLLRFLRGIGVVQQFKTSNRMAYRLTPTLIKLYNSVLGPIPGTNGKPK